jgi:hypothetical protein
MRQLGVPQRGVTGQDDSIPTSRTRRHTPRRELAHLQAIYDEHRKARHGAPVAYKPADDTPPPADLQPVDLAHLDEDMS